MVFNIVASNRYGRGEVERTPFYLWSIAQAWEWLINVPVLGIVFLVVLGLVILTAMVLMGLFSD
jgi:hypothetical protein